MSLLKTLGFMKRTGKDRFFIETTEAIKTTKEIIETYEKHCKLKCS